MAVFTKLLKEDIENFISDYTIGDLENFEEIVDQYFSEVSDMIVFVEWENGSTASIREFEGYFIAEDEAERYGPYKSLEEAKIASGLDKPERDKNPIVYAYGI